MVVEAGFPPGVFQFIHGTREACEALIDSPTISGITFVGSTPIAKSVADRCHSLNKKVIALGGAKNHLVALPDCDVNDTVKDIVSSFAGAAGQRCMAATVLLVVGDGPVQDAVIQGVVDQTSKLIQGCAPGQLGPVIDQGSKKKIISYIEDSEKGGAKILLDERDASKFPFNNKAGNWLGPTLILHSNEKDKALHDEIFGPLLSILRVPTWQDAVRIENANPFGNAACIYTSNGGSADWFCQRFRAGMLGVNVGIPVPREPFAFGGLYGTASKFGDGGDITGEGAIEFFSHRIKVTARWPKPSAAEFVEGDGVVGAVVHDAANFNGRM